MTIDNKVYIHLHGVFGSGKTTFGLTGPGPRLFADVEGAALKAKGGGERLLWLDPKKPPPKATEDTTVIVPTNDEDTVLRVIDFLLAGKHDFETFTWDSLTLYQTKLKRELQNPGSKFDPDGEFTFHAWNRVLNHMLMQCEDLLEVTSPHSNNPTNVCLISATDREQTYSRPLLEGQIRKRLPGLVDIHGFMKSQNDKEGNRHAVMYFNPTDLIDAKCRLWQIDERYPKGMIVDPTITGILSAINESN
jgi:hypothetical protein